MMFDKKNLQLRYDEKQFGTKPPELMTVSQLSSACDRLSSMLKGAQQDLLSQDNTASEMISMLQSRSDLWYTKAALLALESSFRDQTSEQRDIIISHLFNMMFFGNRAVCDIAAQSAGRLIAIACESDMTVWTDFLHKALFIKKNEDLRGMSFSEDPLRTAFLTLYQNVRDAYRKPVLSGYASYFKSTRWDTWTCLRLISGILTIPVKEWGAMQRGNIGGFIRYFLKRPEQEVRIASFYLLREWIMQGWKPSEDFTGYLAQSFKYIYDNNSEISPAENELITQLCSILGLPVPEKAYPAPSDRILFRDNLRTNHSWLFKLENLRILRNRYQDSSPDQAGFDQYAAHLLILLRLNPDEIVFHQAGEDILNISGRLSDQQKAEIAKELFKVIETGYDPTDYVPHFLGRFFTKISYPSQEELVGDLQELCNSRDPETVGNTLEAVCCIAGGLSSAVSSPDDLRMLQSLCGMLSQSLYSDMEEVVKHIIFSLGNELFRELNAAGKDADAETSECFADLAHNIMICLKDSSHIDLLCHPEPVRTIALWMENYSAVHPDVKRPVAFYSGTFDPFANGHHAIVRELAEMGYQVYVNVHDFAWDRNIQPLLLRRQIAAMSVTDVAHVFVFPEEITINTDNPKDLARLKELFPDQKVWLVVRNYLVETEPVYQQEPFEGSIHSFPHIVFVRNESHGYHDEANSSGYLKGEMITLKLPVYYEHMTAEEIRQNIQDGKSIDGLVGNQIVNYIRRHNMYSDSLELKPDLAQKPVVTEITDNTCSISLIDNDTETPAGYIGFHKTPSGGLFLDSMTVTAGDKDTYTEILFDEALLGLVDGNISSVSCPDDMVSADLLRRRGFIKDPSGKDWSARTERPVVLFPDVRSCIAEAFAEDERIIKVCTDNARRLQEATSLLFPGNLVLNINTEVMYYRLSRKISCNCISENGDRLCVPFGKILKYGNIPGVKIMPFNTEKRYDPTLDSFSICEKAGHPVLQTQMHTIRSMDMPFMLVDDLFHKGYRMQKIEENLAREGMKEDGIIVGVRSSYGASLAEKEGYNVDAVYDVPNMKLWIIESDMLPFFSGDKVETDDGLRSIYPILPYQLPSFLKNAPYDAVYRLSEVCMENALKLFDTLETVYEEKFHVPLKYSSLSEVIDEPGCPDGTGSPEDIQDLPVTALLRKELICLKRLRR